MTHGIYMTSNTLKGAMLLVWAAKHMLGRAHKVRVGKQDGLWYVAL